MLRAPATITAPAAEPVAIETAREFVGAEGTALDGRLDAAIGMARASLEKMTGLRLIDQVVEVTADRFEDLAAVNVAPVQAVVSITYLDPVGEEHTLDEDAYELIGAEIDWAILPVAGRRWPAVHGRGRAVRARLAVGFGTTGAAVPRDLGWALLTLIRSGVDDEVADVSSLIANWRLYA